MSEFILKHKLILLGLLVNISFYLAAISGIRWYDFFFFGSSVHHCCQGLDFFQIPNAVYAFFNGGDLTGRLPEGVTAYSQNFLSNYNVYHPLFTFILGGFFLLFKPDTSFHLLMIIKFIIGSLVTLYFYKTFKKKKYVDLAVFLLLINNSQYNEIVISQYQFFFNISLLLFLIFLYKDTDSLRAGFMFFLTLIAKPIGLLWIPILLFKRRLTSLTLGISLFLFSTGIFQILGIGDYFTRNIITHVLSPIKTNTIDIMSLDALLRYVFHNPEITKYLRLLFLGIVFTISLNKNSHFAKLVFLLIVYFLFFYDLLYQYHFSVLAPVLSFCLVILPEFQTRLARLLIILINLPTVFFMLRLVDFGVYTNNFLGVDPTLSGWQIVSFFQLLPIALLTFIVIAPELKASYYLIKKWR